MRGLTRNDLYTTLLAAVIFGVGFAMARGIELPLVSGVRAATAFVGLLGIGMCATVGQSRMAGSFRSQSVWIVPASILGVAAAILAVAGLITGEVTIFYGLVTAVLVLWLMATVHHITEHGIHRIGLKSGLRI